MYDTEYPDQTSTAIVPVIVTRNANAPIFERPEYRQSLAENHRLGSSVLQLRASDQDQVQRNLFETRGVFSDDQASRQVRNPHLRNT